MAWFKKNKNPESMQEEIHKAHAHEEVDLDENVDDDVVQEDEDDQGIIDPTFCDYVFNYGFTNGLIPSVETELPFINRDDVWRWIVNRRYMMSDEPLSGLDSLSRFRALVDYKEHPTASIEVRTMLFYYLLTSRFPEHEDSIFVATSPVGRDHYIVKSILDYIDYNEIGGDADELKKLQQYIHWLETPYPIILLPSGTKVATFDPLLSIFSNQVPLFLHSGELFSIPNGDVDHYFEGYLKAAQLAILAKDTKERNLSVLQGHEDHPMTPVITTLSIPYSGQPQFPEARTIVMKILGNRPTLFFLLLALRNGLAVEKCRKLISERYGKHFLVEPKKTK